MNCLISSILRYLVLYHYLWYLLCLRINNYCFVSDYSTAFIGEPWLFLKTRQIQMWIFVNMIMEIDVWLVNKKQVSHIPAALWCLKSFTYIEGVFITNSKLKRVHLSLFLTFLLLTDICFKNRSPSLNFEASVQDCLY